MKWFKHDSNARHSEKIAALEHKAGIEGYGFYFKLLEIVAGLMDENDKCQAIFSPTSWARQTNISTKKWLYLAQCCSDVGLIEVQCDADMVSVNIPKLLKRRDNHTKNLQAPKANQNKKVSLDKEKEIDKEEDREKEEEKSRSPNGDTPPKKPKSRKTVLPDDFGISDRVRQWAIGKNYTRLEERLEHFIGKAKAAGYTYADWDEAFMGAIRDDWAKLPAVKLQAVARQAL